MRKRITMLLSLMFVTSALLTACGEIKIIQVTTEKQQLLTAERLQRMPLLQKSLRIQSLLK